MAILQLVLRFEGNVGAYGTPVSCHPSPFFPLSLCSFILVPFAAMVYLHFLQFIGLNITSKKNGRNKTTSNGPKSNNAWSDFIYDMELPFGSVSKGIFCELEPSTRPLQRQQHYKAGHRCFNILYKRYQSTSKEAIRHTHTCPIIKSQHKADCIPKESIT